MSVAPGTRFGPYEVVALLGAGGMGEVYRARDTRLDRAVAVKVLPAAAAGDSAFRNRLHTEARAISQLSHPHICTLHDIGEQDGTTFLVMELIQGETLADRLRKQEGRGLAVAEALRLAAQIADALAAAHRQGITHRDLKPGNVMLTRGRARAGEPDVKLLDFGLARIGQPAASSEDSRMLTEAPQTAAGSLLGTFQYMAPEQIEGDRGDARSDVFAFGCVLYEMLTGRRAFDGKSSAAIMAAILEREPALLVALDPQIPPLVASLVEKCLAKSPEDRWQSAADLGTALRWIAAAPPGKQPGAEATTVPHRSTWKSAALVTGLMLLALAIGAMLARRYLASTAVPANESRFEVTPPPGTMWSPSPVASTAQLALSPDGRQLAFIAAPARETPRIWIRALDSLQARPLEGTDDAAFPFWSPDGRSIAFFAGGRLKKISTAGGTPQVLADASLGRGGSWSRDDVIIFTPSPNTGIWRVPAAGGPPSPVTRIQADRSGDTHVYPQFLPDGRRFIYYARSDNPELQGIYVTDLASEEPTLVIHNYGVAVHAPGYLLIVRDGTLFAQAVDDATMLTRGDPMSVAGGVGFTLGTIGYSPVSATGSTLAYGPSVRLPTALQWRDRTGAAVGPVVARGDYRSPRLSVDGQRVALTLLEERAASPDIWILELARGTFTRVSHDQATDWFPVWAADGERLFFGSARGRATTLFQKDLRGMSGEEALHPPTVARYPLDVTSDGRLVYQTGAPAGGGGYDLGMIKLTEGRTPVVLLSTPFNEVQARVSPNNRWMAYASDESGRFEVHVRGLQSASGQWTISPAGGMQPEWRRDGRELFYVSRDRKLMAVPVTIDGDTFSAGVPRPLFEVGLPEPIPPYTGDYAVSADGQRFLLNAVVDQPNTPPLTVVLNWAAALKK
jgi:serine/threonine protein kinase/Tol biopolymer transport system component